MKALGGIFLATIVAPVVWPNIGAEGIIIPGPCVVLGNPWTRLGTTNRRASIVAMMGENAGHNPFNTFPEMEVFGNCLNVYFTYMHDTINITVACKKSHDPPPRVEQCPQYTKGVLWPLANLIYVEYDKDRFELSSCVGLNETHSYYGNFLLLEEVRGIQKLDHLPMWNYKLDQPGTTRFDRGGNCNECNFRNEYVAFVPNIQKSLEEAPGQADPYCKEGSVLKYGQNHPLAGVSFASWSITMKLVGFMVLLLIGGTLLRYSVCAQRSTPTAVAPAVPTNDKV